jgi:hypothetical protein
MMLCEPLSSFMSQAEMDAIELLRTSFGIDVTQSFQFWEAAVARITAGNLTPHQCPWDVEIPYGRIDIRVEVKSSREFDCRFRSGTRPVFKFAQPKGDGAEKAADVIVLIGLDVAGVHTWAVPANSVNKCSSITLTSPRLRRGQSRSRGIDQFLCPPTQLLPEIIRASRCHLHYDKEHHAETAYRTRREGLAVTDMFDDLQFSIGDQS